MEEVVEKTPDQPRRSCIQRLSYFVVDTLESSFYRYGECVASHPWRYIVGCLVFTGVACVGFFNFHQEHRPERLWIPQNSDYVRTLDWQAENFPQDQRMELILYEAENVLTADYVREMYRVHQQVTSIVVSNAQGINYSQDDLCFRVPALGGEQRQELRRIKQQIFPNRDPNEDLDWSLVFDKSIYYQFYTKMPTACLEVGLLEVWGYNPDLIHSLTDEDVLYAINTVNMSATFSYPMNFTEFLGGVTRNASGHLTGARTALTILAMQVSRTRLDEVIASSAGLSDEVDAELFAWEGEYIRVLNNNTGRPQGLGVFIQSQRSFGEISGDTILGDVAFLVVGNVTLFIYVQLMLGKFNMVENRPLLSLLGLLSTFMAVGVSFGLCSAVGLLYGPVHTILPLLMLGLGVDDMFVIVQCWHNLTRQERRQEMKKRVGCALRHAGVAITVTSLTDFAAFIIGSTTVLPALRSFCMYSAIGIATLYVFQATFFVAWFTLDQTRLEDKRNGLIWCYQHKNWTPNSCSQRDLCQTFFDKMYSRVLLMKPIKVAVLAVTAVMFGASVWGVTNLRQEFNPVWFIPQSSYLFQFLSRILTYYPQAGERGAVYLGALNYSQEFQKIGQLTAAMKENEYISAVDSWYDLMVGYTKDDTGEDIGGKALNDTFFRQVLSAFLFSPAGSRFQTYFHFQGNLTVAQPTPPVTACKFDYSHRMLEGRDEQITAMDQIKQLVNDAGFSDFAAPLAMMYSSWETNKVIMVELVRNLSLAIVAVFLMTLVLIANLITSCYVLLSVTITLVNVMALMTWWDLTIDIITCINLVLCIGLCVDYSAHIALHFMQVRGSRDERVRLAVKDMGPPVINGAFSTFLAFVFLARSDSHVFLSFFKRFLELCLD
ncbi:patched domain-containing protein 3 isoform X2 [Procambarus clarkii]|uniref:patched domain-containing protein 3 isoform X2 n=1 Tax=Procambarus clarkii TaxID=6728 RepID=UPI001E673AD9|nr:protein patched homolog 1-like isoform X2 [Procambarus clarkii]